MNDKPEIDKNDVFLFLDALRDSGVTNMFGAAVYVEEEFNCDRNQAREYLTEWMGTFSERHT